VAVIKENKHKMKKITTLEMECVLARNFDRRTNLIVPNVSWGMFHYELDLVVLTPSGYATEIEIKVSKSDLKKDKEKFHNHENDMIKTLYFAIPEYIDSDFALTQIPYHAGLLVVYEVEIGSYQDVKSTEEYSKILSGEIEIPKKIIKRVKEIKKPVIKNNPYKWNDKERYELSRLGSLRIWGLKEKLIKGNNK